MQGSADLPTADILTWADALILGILEQNNMTRNLLKNIYLLIKCIDLVYSITDRASFTYLKQVWKHVQVRNI